MPYGGESSLEQVAKIERCEKELKAKHPDWSRSRCIATCKASILGKGGKRRGAS
jgi:hypothetical protein